MKSTRVAALAALGMFLTSVTVYSLTPPGGFGARPAGSDTAASPEAVQDPSVTAQAVGKADLSRFTDGKTLTIEGRVGTPQLAQSGNGETFVMLEVKAADGLSARNSAPVNLSIVMDRSGSMKGTRIRNAINGAVGAVERLADGDTVNVVTFDTQTQVVVPNTTITASSRQGIESAIRGIGLGGDTCISCGLEQGMTLLGQAGGAGRVNRIILLSDGDANHGVRDVPGFRSIAARAQARGVSVTTVGVDVDYNEKIMAAIAQDSNGRHYFVADDSGLARVFEEEAQTLTRTLASNAEVAVELAPGVELNRVFDRSFRHAGNQVIVPLGTFAGSDVKTVLLKVRVPHAAEGPAAVASVELGYRDLVTGNDGRCGGKLGAEVVAGTSSQVDSLVEGRIQRSETTAVLKEANALVEQGKLEEARRRLESRETSLRNAAAAAKSAAPATRARDVDRDFNRQLSVLDDANKDLHAPQFATPPAGAPAPAPPQESRAGKAAVRANQSRAFDMGL